MVQPTQRDLQAEARRSQLLDIALALFAERGVENVSIKDIAAEAHIAQGLIYYYFKSKDELLAAVVQEHTPTAQFQAIALELDGLPAHEGLTLLASRLAALLSDKRPLFRLLLREMLSPRSNLLPQVVAFREGAIALFAGYLRQRVAAGELRPHEPMVSLQMLVSTLLILVALNQPLEPFVPHIVETLYQGIRAGKDPKEI